MDHVIRSLIERLTEKGMEVTDIPPFIRTLAHTISIDPSIALDHLNRRIALSGYKNFELDEYTFQLVMVILTESLNHYEPGETLWFEYGYHPAKVVRISAARRR